MDWMDKIPLREPYESETDYFKSNPNVAGMAAEDDAIVLNPFSKLDHNQKAAVMRNEASRIFMRRMKNRPAFNITDEQRKMFNNYGNEQDIRETIAGRIFSGDNSSGIPTQEQIDFVNKYLRSNP